MSLFGLAGVTETTFESPNVQESCTSSREKKEAVKCQDQTDKDDMPLVAKIVIMIYIIIMVAAILLPLVFDSSKG